MTRLYQTVSFIEKNYQQKGIFLIIQRLKLKEKLLIPNLSINYKIIVIKETFKDHKI